MRCRGGVFPRLRECCQKHGCRFQAIDLSWGVSEEAAADKRIMRICRAEIACCQTVAPRPSFVVLLGDRHGWRPLPDETPAAEFEALLPHLPAELVNRPASICPPPFAFWMFTHVLENVVERADNGNLVACLPVSLLRPPHRQLSTRQVLG